ncbi:uncharacterized protein [Venturia canescens]|nr:uncharacterized protein LOC122415677 isoform X2 [Venturia canescens]
MATPTRDFLRRPDTGRRRSVRQALAVIPDMMTTSVSPGTPLAMEVSAMDNVMNSRYSMESWSPAPSPDELVIQKRGRRRRTIVWSPDADAKRDSLFSLSSRDRTPVKSPSKSTIVLRSTPRKRLMLGGDNSDPHLTTPEKKTKSHEAQKYVESNCNGYKQFTGPLVNGLRGLSQEQLIKVIMDLISMQEDGALGKDDKLRDVVLKRMPIADIQPLRERLSALRQNVYASLVSSDIDESSYSRAYIHLDAFEKAVIEQGNKLIESQHWTAAMQYVFAAWSITKDLPEWDNQGRDNTTKKCFRELAKFCKEALQNGNFITSTLDVYCKK